MCHATILENCLCCLQITRSIACKHLHTYIFTQLHWKGFGKCHFKHVFNFYRDTNFFSQSQSGFMTVDSIHLPLPTNILYDPFCKALDNGLNLRNVFFDISKAFESRIKHCSWCYIRLEKNHSYLLWFTVYLSNLRHQVVILGSKSDLAYCVQMFLKVLYYTHSLFLYL